VRWLDEHWRAIAVGVLAGLSAIVVIGGAIVAALHKTDLTWTNYFRDVTIIAAACVIGLGGAHIGR
jgi:hypothetical protein